MGTKRKKNRSPPSGNSRSLRKRDNSRVSEKNSNATPNQTKKPKKGNNIQATPSLPIINGKGNDFPPLPKSRDTSKDSRMSEKSLASFRDPADPTKTKIGRSKPIIVDANYATLKNILSPANNRYEQQVLFKAFGSKKMQVLTHSAKDKKQSQIS